MIRTLWFFLIIFPLLATGVSSLPRDGDFLSSSEIAWLKEYGQHIRYAPIANYPPIEFVDGEGFHKGVTADYIAIIEEKIGVKFDRVYLNTWNEAIEGAKQGQIDVLGNLQNTPERSQYLVFTQPYLTIPNVIIVRTQFEGELELAEMGGMQIAVVKGYASIPFIQKTNPKLSIHPVDNDEQGLKMVSFGQLDGMITDLSVASFTLDKLGINNLKVVGNIDFDWKMSIGVRKDWPVLQSILGKALASINTGERQKIYKKWISHDITPPFDWMPMLVFFLVILLAVFVVAAWNFSLKRQVKKQTMDLKEELNERKKIEGELRQSEDKFRLIFEHSPLALVHLNKSGVITAANDNLCKILGSSKDRIIGFDALQSLVDKDMLAAIIRAFGGRKSRYDGVYLSVTGGLRTPIRAIYAPILTSDGLVAGVIGLLEDISGQLAAEADKKKLESQLRQSQKMEAVGTLSGGIAHDFNNILGIILGNVDIALMKLPGQTPALANLKAIKIACVRAADVIRHLLIFSRKTDPTRKIIHINDLVKESVKLLRSSISTAIEIQTDLSQTPGMVNADPTQVHQVLINLCTNAGHAMEGRGGVLKVTSRPVQVTQGALTNRQKLVPGAYVELIVSDTGHGIDPETLNRVFDPYFTTKEVGKGTGMGLAIVHSIVKEHGGYIFVDSEPGKGTQVRIFFPITDEKPCPDLSDSQETGSKNQGTNSGAQTILIVEDEVLLVNVMARMLQELGYETDPQTCPEKALDLFRFDPSRFDLVITDMAMPKMQGDALSQKIIEIRPDIPIILCSGFAGKVDIQRFTEIGIRKYLEKPFGRRQLSAAVKEVLT
ncbi:MAG: transporter substrate-binding domain-containing protein [Proteobacteria bacterium]|nr:transporter substrate-binding domain-containing protein [Desulfobacula sp.]MBU3954583.1 transporter substrate-binding domain-containing protein [Pseudomonadota bacterium]MBU4132478.1 transporter substrate-binding domain-containing protein [Pseudomonadota bacterium]